MAGFPDHYKTLQVDPAAEPEVIAAAYRRLAAKYHPDVCPDPAAAERMVALNLAYEVLSDPARRAVYHRQWQQHHRPEPAPPPAGPPRPGRPHPRRSPRPGHYPSARPVSGTEPPPIPEPTLVLTPAVLDFGRVRRGHCPTLTLQMGVTDGGALEARVRGTQPWVQCHQEAVNGAHGNVQVRIDTAYLEAQGRYCAALIVETDSYGQHEVPIYLYLLAAPRPYVMITPTALDFGAVRVGSASPSLPLRVLNGGRGTLEGVAAPRVPWLRVEPVTFRGNRVDLCLTAQVDDLAPGRDHTGQLDIATNGGAATAQAIVFVLRPARPLSPWRDDTPADCLFLEHRAWFLSQITHPTGPQMMELELVKHLQANCPAGEVSRVLQRAMARLQGFPVEEEGISVPPAIPLTVLNDVFQRLRRWEAYRG